MEQIKAVDMVRKIRDEIYDQTKDFSPEELKDFFHRKASAVSPGRKQTVPTEKNPPPREGTM